MATNYFLLPKHCLKNKVKTATGRKQGKTEENREERKLKSLAVEESLRTLGNSVAASMKATMLLF